MANHTDETPPKIHDLNKLAERAALIDDLSEEQLDFLEELTPFNIEARYPSHKEIMAAKLTENYSKTLLVRSEAFLCWTKKKLGK